MQEEPSEILEPVTHQDKPSSTPPSQHGTLDCDPSGLGRILLRDSNGSPVPRSGSATRRDSAYDIDANLLDEELRRLSLDSLPTGPFTTAGQRISEYENAMTPPTPKKALGFKIIKRSETSPDGIQLTDFPNGMSLHSVPLRSSLQNADLCCSQKS